MFKTKVSLPSEITRKIISGIGFILRYEIVKAKRARVALQIASFSWSILSLRQNLDVYCKKRNNNNDAKRAFQNDGFPKRFSSYSSATVLLRVFFLFHFLLLFL